VTIIQAADGRLNLSSLGAGPEARPAPRPGRSGGGSAAAGAVAATRVLVDGGTVVYIARGKGEAAPQYRLTDASLTLVGGASQITLKGDMKLQPGDIRLALRDAVVGLVAGKPPTDASLRGKLSIDGKDIAPLTAVAVGPVPALGGAVSGTLALGGTVAAPTASGELTLSGLTATQSNPSCPEPKRRTLTVPSVKANVAWQDQRLTGRPVTASLAGGTVTTQLTVALDRGMHVQLAGLGIKTLPLEKILVDYLCQGYAITGPLDLTGQLTFDAHDVLNTLSGPGQLHVGRGKVVGSQALALFATLVRVGSAVSSILSADVPTAALDSPLEFDSITGTYTLTNGVATTRDLLYTSRTLKVGIAGDYALASGRMNLDMTVSHRRGELKAKVTGTAASPSVAVSPASILRDVDPEKAQKRIQDLLKRFGR
jgi:hypothetical protein